MITINIAYDEKKNIKIKKNFLQKNFYIFNFLAFMSKFIKYHYSSCLLFFIYYY